jgi:signal transduction histidine kinase
VTARLLATMLALTAVLLGVLVVPLGIESARSERRDLRAKVERDATAVASLAEDALQAGAPAPPALTRLARRYLAETGGRIVVVDRDGTSIVDAASPIGRDFSSRPEIATALDGSTAAGVRHSDTLDANLLYVAVPVASGGVVHGASRITYPTSTADARVRHTWLALAAISAFALAVAAGLAVWLARWASRPLVRLEAAATGVAAGNLAARAPVEGPPEVRAVAASFNAMVERVESMLDDQSAFVADASHQLRTPLTALRLRLENLAAETGPQAEAGVEAAAAEVDRLAELVDGLLALARADAGATAAAVVDARPIVIERADAWEALAAERGIDVRVSASEPAKVRVARERLEQVLDNLVSNAIEAVGSEGSVELLVGRRGAEVEIRIRDDGPGLAADDRAHAFDRFWRRRDTAGSGLGLAIARRLVEVDGGTIALDEAPGGGLDAIVTYRAS